MSEHRRLHRPILTLNPHRAFKIQPRITARTPHGYSHGSEPPKQFRSTRGADREGETYEIGQVHGLISCAHDRVWIREKQGNP